MTKKFFQRIHIIVLDSVGIGASPDAAAFGDAGADTLGHIAAACGGLTMPHMERLGLGNIRPLAGVAPAERPSAYYTKMREASNGKDTMTGHWELMGLFVDQPLRVFPHGFPAALIRTIEEKTGRKVICNAPASGTEIIARLGEEHLRTGALIVYTSADSVLQIAAHEDIVPLEELYRICDLCRRLTLDEPYKVGRVIARPFIGRPGDFSRTANRRDYALKPTGRTVMNELKDHGLDVIAIGKINDIYHGEGVTRSYHIESNEDGMNRLAAVLRKDFHGISFLNLVDFDAKYGHRRDPAGYGRALEAYDAQLPDVLAGVTADDLLLITADHGNDPTYHGADHTREYVPLLAYSPRFQVGRRLPVRQSFADLGATVAENFAVPRPPHGLSFWRELA